MSVLVFKTDIGSHQAVEDVKHLFNQHPFISDWSVDTEDIDNVLRVVTEGTLFESDIIKLISQVGFHGQSLPD